MKYVYEVYMDTTFSIHHIFHICLSLFRHWPSVPFGGHRKQLFLLAKKEGSEGRGARWRHLAWHACHQRPRVQMRCLSDGIIFNAFMGPCVLFVKKMYNSSNT